MKFIGFAFAAASAPDAMATAAHAQHTDHADHLAQGTQTGAPEALMDGRLVDREGVVKSALNHEDGVWKIVQHHSLSHAPCPN